MAAPVILVEAQPRHPGDGTPVTVRLAGAGGNRPYYYAGMHWRAGLAGLPKVTAALDFDGEQLGGGGVAQALTLSWGAASNAALAELAALYWADAPITVRVGPEGEPLPPVLASGLVLDASVEGGQLRIALADAAADLKRPLLVDRYAGTGGLDGPPEWKDKIKPRAWGRCFNVRGEVIDPPYNIWCFGDPRRAWLAIDEVRDMGVAPAPDAVSVLAWQGSAEATFTALQAAQPVAGGGVLCPSIACVKWWTQPAGDLHADIRGETAGGYAETAAEIAARIVAARSTLEFAPGTVAAAATARPAQFGWRVDSESTTAADAVSQILSDVSTSWMIIDGQIELRPWDWTAPVAEARSFAVVRRKLYKPIVSRRLGYRRNWSPMARGDLAALVFARDVVYEDGTPIEELRPAEPGATDGGTIGSNVRLPDGTVPARGEIITSEGTAADTAAVGGRPVPDVLAAIDSAQADIADLFATYGNTESSQAAKVGAEAAMAAAELARDQAQAHAASAGGSAGAAAGAASTASAKASEASQYAGAASASQVSATLSAAKTLPSDFAEGGKYFARLLPEGVHSFPTLAGEGPVWQIVGAGGYGYVAPLSALPLLPNHRYRFTARVRVLGGDAVNQTYLGVTGLPVPTSNPVEGERLTNLGYRRLLAADGWVVIGGEYQAGATVAQPYIRAFLDSGTLPAGTTFQAPMLRIEDITESYNAGQSAQAAATHASSAAIYRDEAEESAAAAQTHAATASTRAGEASTYANQAATSASTAEGHEIAAASSAGVAASSRQEAEAAASRAAASEAAAATHASTASTRAGEAGQLAQAANQSATSAGVAAGAAETAAQTAEAQASLATEKAAAAQASAVVAASVSSLAINRNPRFAAWEAGAPLPADWSVFGSDGTTARAAGYDSPNAVQQTVTAGGTIALFQAGSAANALGKCRPGWYVIEADVRLDAGSLAGAGLLLQTLTGSYVGINNDIQVNLASELGAGTVGRVYRVRKLVQVTHPDTEALALYLWTGWAALPPIAAKTLTWLYAAVRAATDQEIAAKQAATDISSLQASVSSQQGAIVTLQGRTAAYFEKKATIPGAEAFISAVATNDSGQPTSSVAIGGASIALYNTEDGTARRALYLAAGNAIFDGNLTARAGIRIGDGTWSVAVSPRDYPVSDGEVVSYGYNLGRVPSITFGPCPVPLNNGEVYQPYAENSTATGFTARLRILSAPTTTNYQAGPGSSSGTNQYDIAKAGPDATNGQYLFHAGGTAMAMAYRDYDSFGGNWYASATVTVGLWALAAGVWTKVGVAQAFSDGAFGSGGTKTLNWALGEIVTCPAGVTAFRVVLEDHNAVSASLTWFSQVSWSAQAASSSRSATPNGEKIIATVRPQ